MVGIFKVFEHFLILPLRWYLVHIRNWREGVQRCKNCGCADGFNFHVPDHVWRAVVPKHLENRVVCLQCFDRFAKEKEVDYATSLSGLVFAGQKATFLLDAPAGHGVKET